MNLDDMSLTNFIDLSDSKKLMVLAWRNNEDVRKWMYTSDIISKEEHFSFEKLGETQDDAVILRMNEIEHA